MENEKNILKELSKPLDIKDVDFRIQSINKGGYATILAYKDARVDMNRLDEVCGANWQKDYRYIESKGMLFCRVGIKIGNEWIWREDLGVESFTEKQKGQASDAFKRACFNWGIGRELYDYPLIQVKLNSDEFNVDNNGRAKQTWNLKLKEWIWTSEFKDGKVTSLIAKDEKGNERFNSTLKNQPQNNTVQKTTSTNSSNQTSQKKEVEKPWLNIMDKTKNMTPQWLNVVYAINNTDKINSVEDVRKYYKISKETEAKLTEILNYQTA
ncbi:Rad52/Rad22 family DNA repair protein [Polaribacter aestuariivivens]|uniref:Rad52/Rad22 family DNA repair protein n=1 Tax=Polaribacter aestuariivivens TaxID=2304626 RepID=UPI003F493D9B